MLSALSTRFTTFTVIVPSRQNEFRSFAERTLKRQFVTFYLCLFYVVQINFEVEEKNRWRIMNLENEEEEKEEVIVNTRSSQEAKQN